jgi:hypothetical protein
MQAKKKLLPIISTESQRKIINVNKIQVEKAMTELIAQVVALWTKNTGLSYDERRELTVKVCRMLLSMLGSQAS